MSAPDAPDASSGQYGAVSWLPGLAWRPGDPLAFVISRNVNRCQMGKGALAMAVTKARNPGNRDSAMTQKALAGLVGLNENLLSQASIVYQFGPDLIQAVVHGAPA